MLELRKEGLYCIPGQFYIDPWHKVSHAVITHAHSDHAKAGHDQYLCHHLTKTILEKRLGHYFYQGVEWGKPIYHKGVKISLHPAGHIAGSSQIRIEYKGEIWVVSGDYKTENDGISSIFEPIQCHTFISESTFGLPVYKWEPQNIIYEKMRNWVLRNFNQGFNSVFFAYSLGKAQRVAEAVSTVTENVILHSSAYDMHILLQENNITLPNVIHHKEYTKDRSVNPTVIIAPMSTINSSWLNKFSPFKTAICSGWMLVRGHAKRQGCDAGFVLSDHADWEGLIQSIDATGAENILITHGYESVVSRYLQEKGMNARELNTQIRKELSAADDERKNELI
jgi:putative mRNA 3-end processing factor